MPMRGISSKLVTPWPKRSRASFSSASALLGVGEADEGGRARARPGEQLQRRGGDDPERALGADEQVLQVVAGVVLAQLGERVDDAPVGEHDLDAGASDRARCRRRGPRRRRRWSRDCRRSCRFLPRRATAGTAGRPLRPPPAPRPASRPPRRSSRRRRRIDLADAVEPLQRQEDLARRSRRASGRRPGRCCRPAARSRCPPPRRRRRPPRLPPSSPGAPPPARGR